MGKKDNFESKIKELEKIVLMMESGDISLDKAMELYEKGTNLAKQCNEELDIAEDRYKKILKQAQEKTFDSDFNKLVEGE